MSSAKKIFTVISVSLLIFAILLVIFFASVYLCVRKNIDYAADEALFRSSGVGGTQLFARDGEGEWVQTELLLQNGVRKVKYSLDEISDYLKLGFVAMEDREFYSHGGVNLRRTLGAALNYIFRSGSVFGASTITQQTVKNISGDNQRTLRRKLSEILRAYRMESEHSKDEILELYLNVVPMTENMAGVGMGAVSYFGKEPSELTLAEAATIIGITNSPAKYNPYKHPDACVEKRNRVLYAMRDFGVIDQEAYLSARSEPLSLVEKSGGGGAADSWFTETVISDVTAALMDKYAISKRAANLLLSGGGYKIYTTENIEIQTIVDEYFKNTDNFPSEIENGLNYAFTVCDSNSGELLAIYGSVGQKRAARIMNYAEENITPGSVLKPLALYAPLIDSGKINWATTVEDSPVTVRKSGDGYTVYPHNSPDVYEGVISVWRALAKSKNTVAVRMYNMLGGENIYYSLKNDFGFDSLVRCVYNKSGGKITDVDVAPLALGQLSYGVPLRKLTSAYTVFQSGGVLRTDISFSEVYDGEGKLIIKNEPSERRIFRESTAKIMNKLLEGVVDFGTARSLTLGGVVDTAGKTGTSGGDRDRLFIGYTPYVCAGIWCGYKDRSAEIGSVSPSHLQIWDAVMQRIHEQILKNNESPDGFSTDGLLYLPYCTRSGAVPDDECYEYEGAVEYGYFESGNTPRSVCELHSVDTLPAVSDGVRAAHIRIRAKKRKSQAKDR